MPAPDLDAYCLRIGYAGSRAPTLETLRALHRLHPAAIPFENLTTLLGGKPPLDIESLENKMVRAGRGGYCFEQNHLFRRVLEALGYPVTGLAARVLWMRTDPTPMARTHMLLSVSVSGRTYISDVGFGGLTLTAPLLLEPGVEQTTPHEVFRIVPADGGYVLEAELAGNDQAGVDREWRALYWFDLNEHLDIDFEVLNHFVATHPASPFPSQLYGARALPDRRVGLRNNRLTVYRADGTVERTELRAAAELRDVLISELGIALPEAAELDEALTRVIDIGRADADDKESRPASLRGEG